MSSLRSTAFTSCARHWTYREGPSTTIFRKADRTQYLEEQRQLMLQVRQIFGDSKQRYGAEKIRVVLAEGGVHVGKERIRKIMRELDLVSVREDAKRNFKKRREYQKRNLLKQSFKASQINEIWVGDITYFKVRTTPSTSA